MRHERPVTAQMLEAFALCPMKYRLYHLGDPSRGVTRRIDAARALHAAVKHALDECYRMRGPHEFAVEDLASRFTASFEGRACADSREEEQYREAGLRMLEHYHTDHREDEGQDVRVGIELEGLIGEWRFQSRADRRERRSDGSVAYILYTTARRPPTEGALQDDLRTGVLQVVAEQAEGRPVECELHALRKRQALDATKTPDLLAAIEERSTALAKAAVEMSVYPTAKARHCRWCHARGVCPEWSRG